MCGRRSEPVRVAVHVDPAVRVDDVDAIFVPAVPTGSRQSQSRLWNRAFGSAADSERGEELVPVRVGGGASGGMSTCLTRRRPGSRTIRTARRLRDVTMDRITDLPLARRTTNQHRASRGKHDCRSVDGERDHPLQ